MTAFLAFLFDEREKPDYWQDLYSEYIGLRENKSSLFILSLMKEIAYLKTKHFIIEQTCKMLIEIAGWKHDPDTITDEVKELKTILKDYGFRAEYNLSNKATFTRDIKSALSGAKKIITTWQRKQDELQAYEKRHAGKEVQKKDFFIWGITLGKYMGFRIDMDITTVAEWCQMMNDYERFCEVQNATDNNKLKK
jgi:hypothetical protein